MSDTRTIRVRCKTWEQVEAFYREKLRQNTLAVKMPFRPQVGDSVTVALGLPDGLVFAIDGTVAKVHDVEVAGRFPVALRLLGLTHEVRAQLERLVAEARGDAAPVDRLGDAVPPPASADAGGSPELLPSDRDEIIEEERPIYSALEARRRRLLELPTHEILGVAPGADALTVRRGYFHVAKELHPDVFGRYRSPAVRQLASEIFIYLNRAYDRLRAAAPGRLPGPAAGSREGWIVDLGEVEAPVVPAPAATPAGDSPYAEMSIIRAPAPAEGGEELGDVEFTTSVRMRALTEEELFGEEDSSPGRDQAQKAAPGSTALAATPPSPPPGVPTVATHVEAGREALDAGRWRQAAEKFAAALRVDPRNRPVRALYHVANGMDLRARGEGVKATTQFEIALQHDRECDEARRALAQPNERRGLFRRFFDRS